MDATRAAMHIDIYFIILFQVATVLLVYQVAIPINRVNDENIKRELKKMRSDYDGAISLGDIIVWPTIITIIFPLYILLRLLFKRTLIPLIKVIVNDRHLLLTVTLIITVFVSLVTFALLHWFVAYAILFIPSVVYLIIGYKAEKARYEL